eukprot:5323659-Pyramimonas_sp.AAC.1
MLQEAPRSLQDSSKTPPKHPRRPPASKKPRSVHNLEEINVVCFLAFSLPMAIRGVKMAPRWPKRIPGETQESPKTAPR